MKRTQLYLDTDLWDTLHAQSRISGHSISELVRQAVRERYTGSLESRKQAMQAVVGIWKSRREFGDSTAYVRNLRKDDRLERLGKR